jgi:hypothetical protein
MSAPVEFEYHSPVFTLAMLQAGIQPHHKDAEGTLYGPPALRYRWREKVSINGGTSLQWSAWQLVGYSNGGVDKPTE